MDTIIESAISCDITGDVMTDPVKAKDGKTYERSAIVTWLNKSGTSPINPSMRMSPSDLIVDYNMKSLIDQYNTARVAAGGNSGGSSAIAPVIPFKNADVKIDAMIEDGPANSYMLHTKVNLPPKGDRQPVVLIMGVDVSGSMDAIACDVNEAGGKAFTVLDLVKHTMRVMIGMLNENDTFAIVKYSDSACVSLKPTLMNDEGKRKADQAISILKTENSTNIWDCLRLMNIIANKPEFIGKNVMTTLLTDGVANISPPRGELKTYEMLGPKEMLSTFGFGYQMNSKFLSELASVGNGSFAFIPDYSMVGTVFINFIASFVATASLNRVIKIQYEDGSESKHNTGLMQFGQSRDFVMNLDKKPVQVSIDDQNIVPTMGVISELAHFRFGLLNKLSHCIAHEGAADFAAFHAKYVASTNTDIKEMLRDINPTRGDEEGQISMAPRYWQKWGKHTPVPTTILRTISSA
jgi:hypothetical protein